MTKKARETYEAIRHLDSENVEFWTARELAQALQYSDYRNFLEVARKAWKACHNSGINPADHFVVVTEKVYIGSGAERQIDNIHISRGASRFCVQNAYF